MSVTVHLASHRPIMPPVLDLFPLTAPAALGLVALLSVAHPGTGPQWVLRATGVANLVGLAAATVTALVVALWGPRTVAIPGLGALGLHLRLDALSAVMFGLVAIMGAVVLRFSRTYLEGNERHGTFLGRLALTIGCVMMLVLSGHLVQLAVFWALTSFALHGLLLFHPHRRGAVVAARKKWIVARAGDVCLAGAAGLVYARFGTGDLAMILERAAALVPGSPDSGGLLLVPAAFLVAASAALKSAQFPTHGWLAEVMETPTPVSALLHAGILNGGTFLVARLGEVMLQAPAALHLLVVVGGVTALFGSVVLVTQNSVKVALAYSSAAHMGFMLLLCGLGAFDVAILHLVAHSFYKAHAFLSAGSAVEAVQGVPKGPGRAPPVPSILGGMALAVATVGAWAWALDIHVGERPVSLGLAAVLAIGLTQLWTRGIHDAPTPRVVGRTLLAASATTLSFFVLEAAAARMMAGAVPAPGPVSTTTAALLVAVVALFGLAVVAQLRLPAVRHTPGWSALYVHLRNGLYANTLFDRWVGALRPAASPALSSPMETR